MADLKGKMLDEVDVDMDECVDLPSDEEEAENDVTEVSMTQEPPEEPEECEAAEQYDQNDFVSSGDDVQPPPRRSQRGKVPSRRYQFVESDAEVSQPSDRPSKSGEQSSKKRGHFFNDFDDSGDDMPRKTSKRDMLTQQQRNTIRTYFTYHISTGSLPKKWECEEFLKKEKLMTNKPWSKIKCTVRNEIAKKERREKIRRKSRKE